jgi:hypothetical protein
MIVSDDIPVVYPDPLIRKYRLKYHLIIDVIGCTFRVPARFPTDGASIPRIFWLTTGQPFSPRFITAAIVHDYLYQYGHVERLIADTVFKQILLKHGVGEYQATKMFLALRLGGWIVWNRYRKGRK